MQVPNLQTRGQGLRGDTCGDDFDRSRTLSIAIPVLLAAFVFIAFGRALRYGFVGYDDPDYVSENSHITGGLTLSGAWWAFTHVHASNWHPLTTISHMLDCQLYGLHAWGHHLTNLLLQSAAAILLFLALRRLTLNSSSEAGRYSFWASAFVAALFAIHPLRVESVAWISERKDVLSGVFFMLTLWAYADYAQAPREDRHRRRWLVLVWLALGLMAKPTLVTTPFVLLLLDYWPLKRFQDSNGESRMSIVRDLVLEKFPLFILSAASCVATVFAQQKVIQANLRMTFIDRACNALVSYVAYLGEMFYPAHLVVSHPYAEKHGNFPAAAASLVFLLAISLLCLAWRKRHPFLLTGWFWYVGALVPMIGFVQVSAQARADRYTYIPQIGLYILLAWGAAEIFAKWRLGRVPIIASALVILTALVGRSYEQTSYWQNSETLWRHALDSSTYDYVAHDSLGYALLEQGRVNDAIAEYEKALAIKPDYAESHNNLGNALLQKGLTDDALAHYQKALELEPENAEVHNNLGNILFKQNRVDEAIEQYRKAVAKHSEFAEVQYNLGSAFIVKGEWNDAIARLRTALRINPKYAQAHNKLGIALAASGEVNQAAAEFREALRCEASYAEAHFNLALILSRTGQRREAIEHLMTAVRLKPNYPEAKEELGKLGIPFGR